MDRHNNKLEQHSIRKCKKNFANKSQYDSIRTSPSIGKIKKNLNNFTKDLTNNLTNQMGLPSVLFKFYINECLFHESKALNVS